MNSMKKLGIIFTIVICVFLLLFFFGEGTYSAYESEVNTSSSSTIATWNIEINDVNIVDTYMKDIHISDVVWNSNNKTNSSKVAPGSTGQMNLIINPTTTKVSIRYDIIYEDITVNNNYLLTVLGIQNTENTLVKTGPNTYTGILSLAEIQLNKKPSVNINLSWVNNEANNVTDSEIGINGENVTHCKFKFVAKQYKGETITPYQ